MTRCAIVLTVLITLVAAEGRAQDVVFDASGVHPQRGAFSALPFEHIDPATGGLTLTFTDLVLPGNAGRDLRIQRTYSSKSGYWTFGLAGLVLRVSDAWGTFPELDPTLYSADGGAHVAATALYPMIGGNFIEHRRILMTAGFWKYERDVRRLSMPDGTVSLYDSSGRLTSSSDRFGNLITLFWDADEVTITQDLGGSQLRQVVVTFPAIPACNLGGNFGFPGPCTPESMTFLGRTWSYSGPPLTTVTPPVGPGWQFDYGNPLTVTTPHGGQVAYSFTTRTFLRADGTTADTTVVSSRQAIDVRGSANGTWAYTYTPDMGDLFNVSTVTAPDGTVTTFEHAYLGDVPNNGAQVAYPGRTYLLTRRTIAKDGSTLEDEEREYVYTPIPSFNAADALPALTVRRIVRASREYLTTFSYGTSHYGNYRVPFSVEEDGERARVTTRAFEHSGPQNTVYLVGLVTEETVAIGTDSWTRSWTYEPATGFRMSETIYGIPTLFSRTSRGNVETSTTATGKITTFTYSWGQVSEIDTPEHTLTRIINVDGTIDSETQAGRTTTYGYDALARLTSVQPPGGTSPDLIIYDNEDGATVTRVRGLSTVETTLDGFGRPIQTVTGLSGALDVRTTTEYDAQGRVVQASYPFFDTAEVGTITTYDGLGRVRRDTHPDGSYRERTYGAGTVAIRDEVGAVAIETWEAFGHPDDGVLVTLLDRAGTTWTYTYDALGAVRSVNGGDVTRTWEYNPQHRLSGETHPESGTVTYGYDAAGVRTSQTNAAGVETIYGLDGNDRITSVTAGSRQTTFGYEMGSDRRTSMSVDGVATTFAYDGPTGRLSSRNDVVDGLSLTTSYTYDGSDRLTRTTYPSGRLVDYEYDGAHRITRVFLAGGGNYASGFGYHASGGITTMALGNGTSVSQAFDPERYWLTALAAGPLSLPGFDRNAAGDLEAISDSRPGFSQTFGYDDLHRLTSASGTYGSRSYGYDAHGNLQASAFTYTGNPFRLATVNGQNVVYDTVGRMTTGPGATYSYTSDHRLASATVSGTTSTFRYDGDGWRVGKTVGGVTSYFVRGPDGQLLAERVVINGTPHWRDYIYAGTRLLAVEAPTVSAPPGSCAAFTDPTLTAQSTLVRAVHLTELRTCVNALRAQWSLSPATWTDPTIVAGETTAKAAHVTELRDALAAVYNAASATPPAYTDPTLTVATTLIKAVHVTELRSATQAVPPLPPTIQTYYYHLDHLGSVRAMTDAAGQTVARYDFAPFGEEVAPPASFRDPRLFAGGERDAETTLDYFGARHFGATLARFISPDDPSFGDPLDPQSLNQYAYARNNPLGFIDPTGHVAVDTGYLDDVNEIHGRIRAWLRGVADVYLNGFRMGHALVVGIGEFAFPDVTPESLVSGGLPIGPGAIGMATSRVVGGHALRQLHHVATDKALKSGFTTAFERIFAKAGLTLQHSANKVVLQGHIGRHSAAYHRHVLDRLTVATRGLNGEAYTRALIGELDAIKRDLLANPGLLRGVGLQ